MNNIDEEDIFPADFFAEQWAEMELMLTLTEEEQKDYWAKKHQQLLNEGHGGYDAELDSEIFADL